jgi:hypothetical protein
MADSVDNKTPVALPAPDRPTAPAAPPAVSFDALQPATRLSVGLALIGGDELLKRVQHIEQAINTTPPDPAVMVDQIRNSPTGQYIPDDVRHALTGLAFEMQAQVRANTSRWLAAADQIFTGLTNPRMKRSRASWSRMSSCSANNSRSIVGHAARRSGFRHPIDCE